MSVHILLLPIIGHLALWSAVASAATLPTKILSPAWLTSQDGTVIKNETTTTTNIDSRIDAILSFWFDPRYPYTRWFMSDPAFDAQIAAEFGNLVSLARTTTRLDHWAGSSQGCLALIILLDQFPRNIFRTSSDAYSSDAEALSTAARAVEQELDRGVPPIQQVFYYLPYMHDESLQSQDAGVSLYEGLTQRCEADAPEKAWLDSCVDFAVRHQKVIQKFGRFPARNAVLHRQSTPAEIEFLKTHPEGY